MHQTFKHQALIVLVGAAVFFTNLGTPALWDDDEPRNAQCACEMLARGDWIVPTFNQELRTDKPVLLYWLMFAAYTLFGSSEFAARCWSATLAIGTSLLTYHLGRRLFRPDVGLWAGLMMASSLMFGVAGRAATPDSTLIFFTTLTFFFFVRFGDTGSPAGVGTCRGARYGYGLIYAAMGLAVLAKGPVAIVLPGAVLGLYRVWQIRGAEAEHASAGSSNPTSDSWLGIVQRLLSPRLWLRAFLDLRPLTAVMVIAAVVLPWYVWVTIRTEGQWLAGFLGKHNVQRFLSPLESHRGPIIYYVPAIFVGFFPWSVLLPLALVELVRKLRERVPWKTGYQLIACWAAVYVVFFSLAATKLPSYVLPAYPALALMTSAFLSRWIVGESDCRFHWMQSAMAALGIVGAGMVVGLTVAAYHLLPEEKLLGLIGLILMGGAALGFVLLAQQRRPAMAATMAVTATVFSVALLGIGSARVSQHVNNTAIVDRIRQDTANDFQLAAFRYSSPSLVYYANQRVTFCEDINALRQFFQHSTRPYLVTSAEWIDELRGCLPGETVELLRQRRFLRSDEVVLIGPAPTTAQSNSRLTR